MSRTVLRWLPLSALALCAALGGAARGDDSAPRFEPADIEFFENNVRPILVARCHECHSASEQKGNLRLDSRAAALTGGDTGPALVPAKPDESLLVDAIRYGDTYQMPPKSQLPAAEIDALTEWVRRGAPWPAEAATASAAPAKAFDLAQRAQHWSLQPITDPPAPKPQTAGWSRTSVDRFLLARLESAGVAPNPPADKRTLLRRVTFDLIGLPPTPDEIQSFLADESPQAYEQVVERLLASPHYGERWGRHWLDLVRYAETYGHEFDRDIPNAYRYRDYVIRAFNTDVPYDQFVLEHLAGDLLPTPRVNEAERINESVIGTGYWFLGESTHSPVDVRADEANRIDNQIDVFGKAFLGLTIACARCHDHKFDAIKTQDYYGLAGYLQSSRYDQAFIDLPGVFAPHLAQLESLAADERQHAARLRDAARQHATEWAATVFAALATDEATQRAAADPADPLYAWGALSALAADASVDQFAAERNKIAERLKTASQANPPADAVEIASFTRADWGDWVASGQAFGAGPAPAEGHLSLPAAHSGRLAGKLRGTLRSPTFTIEKPKFLYLLAGTSGRVRLIVDGLQLIQYPIYGGLGIKPASSRARWHVQDVSKWIGHRAYLELLDEDDGYLALMRVAAADGELAVPATSAPIHALAADTGIASLAALREAYERLIARILAGEETAADLVAWVRPALSRAVAAVPGAESLVAEQARLVARRESLEAALPVPRQALAMADGTGENERIFIRGNHKNLGAEAPRRNLEALSGDNQPAPISGSGRLELARRLVDPTNPLVARVLVNRVWKHHFGEGLVSTPDDFGAMGQPPTHPELLDHLATLFVREGWSIKQLHRLLLLSSAYQMSSAARPELASIDPQNKLLHRMPIRRLEAESVRDALLAVSGRLDSTIGGPSVPPHLTEFMQGRGRPEQSGPLDGGNRRSIYLNLRRNFLPPFLLAFDYPTPFTTIGRRSVSNVPAQALSLLNNPFVAEQAEYFAQRILAMPMSQASERIAAMYELAFARAPSEEELSAAEQFLQARQAQHSEQAALAELAHVLFNVKEFVFIQ
ncbi:MAG: PSD1 and planctomycete cytochrome C domain-containing protein [Pirellulales bacterium]|nr:PSD1 and planctomycete cytochrome C domain-containing protein [Pirellulales bacterium]